MLREIDESAIQATLMSLRAAIGVASSLQEAAQRAMECFYQRFSASVVLARTYATVPCSALPAKDRSFVTAALRSTGDQSLDEETRVLSLLGTSGIEPAWCDRYSSASHLCIPLISEDAVSAVPMVAGLTHQLGRSVDWYGRLRQTGEAEQFGVFADSFFAADAASSRDASGRLLIPAQDFVRDYKVRTVLGVGGQFSATHMILVCIFFCRERLDATPGWLLRLPLLLGTSTLNHLTAGHVYSPGKG